MAWGHAARKNGSVSRTIDVNRLAADFVKTSLKITGAKRIAAL
jgi:hypothetical protein